MIINRLNDLNFENIFNSLPISILIIDKFLKIDYANLKAKEELNFNDKLEYKSLMNIFSKDNILIDTIKRVEKEKKPIFIEKINLTGFNFFFRNINIYVSNYDEKYNFFLVLLSMKTFIDNKEDFSLKTSHEFSKLSKILSHEIKNPLSAIKGSAQLLSHDLKEDKKELSDIIIHESDRIEKIINKIEYLFSNEIPEAEELNIHEVIDKSIKIAKTSFAKNLIFIRDYDPSLPCIYGDRDSLIQLFINVFKNSSDAIKNNVKGIIDISSSYALWAPNTKYLGNVNKVTPITIEISDNGEGVPDHLKDIFFNPFVTGKKNGSGLGLTQVQGAMTSHQGTIEYLVKNNKTTFRLSFPLIN